jgi:hypothetical protein
MGVIHLLDVHVYKAKGFDRSDKLVVHKQLEITKSRKEVQLGGLNIYKVVSMSVRAHGVDFHPIARSRTSARSHLA